MISDYNHQGVDRPLSRIQLEMVALVANGYRPAEIAEIVHRSESSVEKTLRTAKRNTGARTMAHLVSLVISTGVLEWLPDEQERKINGR